MALVTPPPSLPARGMPALVALSALVAAGLLAFFLPFLADLPLPWAVAAVAVYLLGHVLRGVRLAILSIDLLGLSGRTAALMHLVTAPMALAMPLKSGEILRWHQLWRLGGSAVYAVIVLLIERMFDALFLVPILVLLLARDSAPGALTVLTLLAATVPPIVLGLGPKLLTETQRYMVVNHDSPGALPLLRHVLWLRQKDASGALEQCAAALLLALHAFCTGRWRQAGLHRPELEHPVLRAVFDLVAQTWRGGVLLPLTLRQLAAAGGVTPNHLIRLFRRELGATP
ncbi:MAG: hypothetical protein ACOCTP_00670, partial [Roseicyclus sp.]